MTTLSTRLVLVILAIHAVMLPVLFITLSAVVRQNMTDAFVDDARVQGRVIADNFRFDRDSSDAVLTAQLDSAMLGARVVHASLQRGDVELTSSLLSAEDAARFKEDFEYGQHGDSVYYLALPLSANGVFAMLHLGFDETHTSAYLVEMRRWIIQVLVVYILLVLIASVAVSRTLTRPLRWLQRTSRSIALGDYHRQLESDSRLTEIHELAKDLDEMRRNLVKVNDRLRHAQRLESLGTLAGGVAHEFNNVLQPLIIYADLALEDLPPGDPAAEHVLRIKELSHRARGLSHQILTFGRTGEDPNLEVVELGPVVQEAIAMIRALVPATVDLRTRIRQRAGPVYCDPAQIQQLIVNLCNNGLQSLSAGKGYVCVELSSQSVGEELAARYPHLEVGSYVVLSVEDSGHGMDAETLERVYEPFFTTQEVGKGTGLGLSVVHGIVRRHEGEIILTSEPGKGTKFCVYLPRADRAHITQE